MRSTQVSQEMLTAGCVFAAAATGCFALAACGGEAKVSEPEQTVAQTTQATPTAQPQERQWSFRGLAQRIIPLICTSLPEVGDYRMGTL